jgi:DNA-binding transcriptional MerR regulator
MDNNSDKQYYKIKDVADILGVPQSTLRFWEKEFDAIRPRRSASNIRYYTPRDIETLRIISFLVKDKGLKLEAAKEQLHNNRANVTKRLDVINRLQDIRNVLSGLLEAMNIRK